MSISLPFYKISKSRPFLKFDLRRLRFTQKASFCQSFKQLVRIYFSHILKRAPKLHAGKFIPSPPKNSFLGDDAFNTYSVQCAASSVSSMCSLVLLLLIFIISSPPAISTTYTFEINSVNCLKIRDQNQRSLWSSKMISYSIFLFKWTICYLIENRCC